LGEYLLYDSHVHLLGTSEWRKEFLLHQVSFSQIRNFHPDSSQLRQGWWIAYGCNPEIFRTQEDHQTLDRHFDQLPVVLVTADGHGAWVNSCARKKMEQIFQNNLEAGFVHEAEKFKMDDLLPSWSMQELQSHLLWALDYFYQAGFGYLRDMGTDEKQWNALIHIFGSSKNKMHLLTNFAVRSLQDFENNKSFYTYVQKESHLISKGQLEFSGIKIFCDGSLGSRTAWISENYLDRDHCGSLILPQKELVEMMEVILRSGFPLSLHSIGDACSDFLVDRLLDIQKRFFEHKKMPWIHFEHAQLVQRKTLLKMQSLPIQIHMQPSHWLSDKKFLSRCLPQKLWSDLFPWAQMEELHLKFDFGSDSPIESPSLERTRSAIEDLQKIGIPSPQTSIENLHSYF
jgi:predicted amidohydrolase YtcJ